MKILIVNAYQNNPKGQKQIKEFENIIKKLILSQKQLLDTETEFFICDMNNLDDFLYTAGQSDAQLNSAKQFDILDMVFIEGDANLRPWSPKSDKVMTLISNCQKTNKVLWVSQFGFQAMVYLATSNAEKKLNIVNGTQGGSIYKIGQINKEYDKLDHFRDFFLDNVTGDLYAYDYKEREWKPKSNVGMHQRKRAQDNQTYGKAMMKSYVYRPNVKLQEQYELFQGKSSETICYTKKSQLTHYANKEIEFEYLIPALNSWDVHAVNFMNKNKKFLILAESNATPQIAQFSDYVLGTQFNITNKYPLTIQTKLEEEISNIIDFYQKFRPISIKKTFNQKMTDLSNKATTIINFKSEPKEEENIANKRDFKHSGYAMKKSSVPDQVDNNAIGQGNKKLRTLYRPGTAQSKRTQDQLFNDDDDDDNDDGNQIQSPSGMISQNFNNYNSVGINPQRPQTGKSSIKSIDNTTKNRLFSAQSQTSVVSFGKFRSQYMMQQDDYIKDEENQNNGLFLFKKNQKEVRLMLHPNISREGLPDQEHQWIPNQQKKSLNNSGIYLEPSQNNQTNISKETKSIKRIQSASSSRTWVRPQTAKSMVSIKSQYSGFGRNTTMTSTQLKIDAGFDECRKNPIIRTGSPYITDDDMYRLNNQEKDKKNLGSRIFNHGKPPRQVTDSINSIIPYGVPAKNHQFRKIDKQKWVTKQNFMVC